MVGTPVVDPGPMTVDELYAFKDSRPDDENWELVDGAPVLNAAPGKLHQRIVRNVTVALDDLQHELAAPWEVLPGIGVRISDSDRPEPDVAVVPLESSLPDGGERDTNVIVAFEVLSSRPRSVTCAGSALPTPDFRHSPITSPLFRTSWR